MKSCFVYQVFESGSINDFQSIKTSYKMVGFVQVKSSELHLAIGLLPNSLTV